jgi:hypothetical protein
MSISPLGDCRSCCAGAEAWQRVRMIRPAYAMPVDNIRLNCSHFAQTPRFNRLTFFAMASVREGHWPSNGNLDSTKGAR